MKISTRLKKLVAKGDSKEVTFNELLNRFDKKDNFFLIILLAIPPATPLSFIPGFSALFGCCISLICIQLLIGRDKIWLPSVVKDKKIPTDYLNEGILKIVPYVQVLEKYIRKRALFISSKFITYFFLFFILILSTLLMLPAPYVDLVSSSTIIMICMGIIQRDGFLMMAALFLILLYLFIFYYILRIVFILMYAAYFFILSLF